MEDTLSALIAHFGFEAAVFFKGDFCGTTDFDAGQHVGHLHFVRQGPVILEHQDREAILIDVPTVVLYPKPFNHRLVIPPESMANLVCATIVFRDLEHNPFATALPDYVQIPIDEVNGLEHITEHLFREASRNEPGQRFVLNRLCDILVFEIIRYVLKHGELKTSLLAGLTDPGIARALTAIHNAPGADWRVGTLAMHASMSRSKFAKRFHDLIGMTPARYLSDRRLALAEHLLQQDQPVKTVASAVGYGTQAAFTKAFTAKTGLSPKQWLRKQRRH